MPRIYDEFSNYVQIQTAQFHMCLVSYIPSRSGYYITSNRDEAPKRSNTPIKKEEIDQITITFPADHKGGSWIFSANDGRSFCILNGAFNNHVRRDNYRMSRGLMLKKIYVYSSTSEFLKNFLFNGIEPFTLIIREKTILLEFRWDGKNKLFKKLDPTKTYVWSSCTLYTEEMQKKREVAFNELLLKTEHIDSETILAIHRNGNVQDPGNNFIMNRENRVATISTTCLDKSIFGENRLIHKNLVDDTIEIVAID